MKVAYLIATCERPKMLVRLLRHIIQTSPFHPNFYVVDDASEADYSQAIDLIDNFSGTYYRYDSRKGRLGYWEVVDRLFKMAKQGEPDVICKLDDDIEMPLHGIPFAFDQFNTLSQHSCKVVLNLWVDHRASKTIWTHRAPSVTSVGKTLFRRVGWVDGGNWMAGEEALDAISWTCPKPPKKWWDRPGDSSGVGKYLSKEFERRGCNIYMPMEPVIFHGTHPSVMHSHKDPNKRAITMDKKPWE